MNSDNKPQEGDKVAEAVSNAKKLANDLVKQAESLDDEKKVVSAHAANALLGLQTFKSLIYGE